MSSAVFGFFLLISTGFFIVSKYCWSNIIKLEEQLNLKSILKFSGLTIVVIFINLIFSYTLMCSNGVSIVFDDGEVLPGLNSNVTVYTEKVGN